MTLISDKQLHFISHWFWQYPTLKTLIKEKREKHESGVFVNTTKQHFEDWVRTLSKSEAGELVKALVDENINGIKFLMCKYAYEDNTGDELNLTHAERQHYFGILLAGQQSLDQ